MAKAQSHNTYSQTSTPNTYMPLKPHITLKPHIPLKYHNPKPYVPLKSHIPYNSSHYQNFDFDKSIFKFAPNCIWTQSHTPQTSNTPLNLAYISNLTYP